MSSESNNTDGGLSIDLLDIQPLKESLKLVYQALNKATSSGSFNLDEAHLLKVACGNIETGLNKLNESQEMIKQIQKNIEQSSEQKGN
jgi:hypothetical protein